MKIGDLVYKVCEYTGEKIRGSTSVVTAVYNSRPWNKRMDIVILNNMCSGHPQRLGMIAQKDYVILRECK